MPIEVELECITAGVAHVVCYWYKLHMATDGDYADAEREMHEIWKKRKKIEEEVEKLKEKQGENKRKEKKFKHEQMQSEKGEVQEEKEIDRTEVNESYGNTNLISMFPYCLNTGPQPHTQHHTRHPTLKGCAPSHFRQAATIISEPRHLIPGDVITVEVSVDLSFGFLCRILSE